MALLTGRQKALLDRISLLTFRNPKLSDSDSKRCTSSDDELEDLTHSKAIPDQLGSMMHSKDKVDQRLISLYKIMHDHSTGKGKKSVLEMQLDYEH